MTLCDLGFGNSFLDMIPKTQITRGKKDKLGFIEIKLVCQKTLSWKWKDTYKKKKKKEMHKGKIFAHPILNKGLVFRIYTGFLKFNNKEKITQFKNWAKDVNKHFSNMQMANKHMIRCSTSLAIEEMQIKPHEIACHIKCCNPASRWSWQGQSHVSQLLHLLFI